MSRHATTRHSRQPAALWAVAAAGVVAAALGLVFGSFAAALCGVDLVAVALVAGHVMRLRLRAAEALLAADHERLLADLRAAEVVHLASVRLPAVLDGVRMGRGTTDVPDPLTTATETGEEFTHALARVVDALADDEPVRHERSLRESAQSAFETSAETLSAMATTQQQRLAQLLTATLEPGVRRDLGAAERAAQQLSRKAQTLLVLCGAWPVPRGNQPVPLRGCVDRALEQIVESSRVDVSGGGGMCVVPHVVDGLTHTLAELLENATVLSPSGTRVAVSLHQTPRSAVVRIEDAGVGMPPEVLAEAARRLRGGMDLAQLGAVPRLGLACAGRWSRALGFGVELTPSVGHGGVRVDIVVPDRLLTGPPGRPAPPEHERADGPLSDLPRTARASAAGHDAPVPPPARPASERPAPERSPARGSEAADGPGIPGRQADDAPEAR